MDLTHDTAIITNPVLIFFIVLMIILLAPLLLRRFKIPHVVGLIVAGVVIGPYGFNILSRDSSFEIFGQVGVLYLMFLAALEIDMFHLKQNISKGFIFGIYTFAIPLVVGMVSSVYLLGVGWTSSILLATMYAAHTLIAYPVISRFDLSKAPVVLISIVGTIIAVLCSLITLAIGVGIQRDGEFNIMYLFRLFGLIIVYGIAVIYIYPRLTRWFFKTYDDNISQFVYVLAMVFLASWIAQVIGLEPVLGAFFAGLVLNRYIPALSPLMNRIEFVGNALFIPYFLIGVGMLINIRVIGNTETLWIAFNMIAIGTVTKWFAAWLAQKTYRLNSAERDIMFGLTNAHTAVALAVVMIGYNIILPDGSHLLSEAILNGTVLMILVSCTIAPIITERAAAKEQKRMKMQGGIEGASSPIKSKMLIALANPITTCGLVELAIMMRGNVGGVSLYALHVRTDDSDVSIMDSENLIKIAGKTAASTDTPLISGERYDLNVVSGIINTMKEKKATEMVIGLHRKANVVDTFLGAKVEQLLKQLNNMIIINRCFIPLSTITRIVVFVSANAEYETGFRGWVIRVANLAKQIGCRAIFNTVKETVPFIKQVLYENRIGIRSEFIELEQWSDYILFSNSILDDDLLVMIGARRSSLSFDTEMDNMPSILSKYFNHNNILIIYPEQFGKQTQISTFYDPLSVDINIAPSNVLLRVRGWYKWAVYQKKKITHRNRSKRY